ncbi:alpha/beta fold hydrolase [Nocardia sp. NPDC019395]|uniref:alpha/beta fold hydrolase n=1 Tax=Nocardia sp. NPDC019395 TaxID=3154686 RepID=UPI0033EF2660
MSYATGVDGAEIWYDVIEGGAASQTPLVLVQGLALDHHGWDSAVADFRGRTTVVFDHRGTGASEDRFAHDWSTRDFARDVISILDGAGIDRAHIYGHSMGGRIAQWLGAEHSERVVSLVLGATTVGDSTGVSRPEHATKALASGDPAELASLFYPAAWLRDHPEEAGSVMPAAASPAAMQAHLGAVARHDGPESRRIGVPALVVHGTDDELTVPANATLLAQHIPDAELVELPGARHAYWVGRPRAHEVVNRFLAANDRSPHRGGARAR